MKPPVPGFIQTQNELWLVPVGCEKGAFITTLRKTFCCPTLGCHTAGCIPPNTAAVLPDGKILFHHFLSVKRFSALPPVVPVPEPLKPPAEKIHPTTPIQILHKSSKSVCRHGFNRAKPKIHINKTSVT